MNLVEKGLLSAALILSASAVIVAQAPPGRGGPRLTFGVSTAAWPDGGEIPMKYSSRGDNKSPAFEFHWTAGANEVSAPDNVKTYAVFLRDMQNATNKTTVDTLHWAVFNIPGTAKGLPEGLASGDLPDGTRNGPGVAAGRGNPPAYFGPGAPAGPYHHYSVEFFALDTKLDVPANVTREDLVKAMDGHIVAKAVYFGKFPPVQ